MYNLILERKSLRRYTGEKIPKEKLDKLLKYCDEILSHPNPFSNNAIRIEYVPKTLNTVGFISGAKEFLVLIGPYMEDIEERRQALAKAGFLFEFVILYAQSLGISTCWVGGSYLTSSVTSSLKQFDPKKESIFAICPIGIGGEMGYVESFLRYFFPRSRMKNEELFFDSKFGNPLEIPEEYKEIFDAVRWAPSAKNAQTWKIIAKDGLFHFYTKPTSTFYSNIDIGIACCHWEVMCKEKQMNGKWEKNDPKIDMPSGAMYFVSWIPDKK